MPEKRYAIVRVDKEHYLNSCPAGFEEINNDFVCSYKKDNILNQYVHNCKKCKYGDTKEQFIMKVETAIKRRIKDEYIVMFGKVIKTRSLAQEIVEFLGVEE